MHITKKHPHAKAAVDGAHALKVEKSCRVQRPAAEVFRFWRNVENLPHFMTQVLSVKALSEIESHWVVRGPGGRRLQWNSVIFNEQKDRLIAWRSRHGADVPNAGVVRFEAVNANETDVRVVLEYEPPAGVFGAMAARLLGESPDEQLEKDLVRFKEMMEKETSPSFSAAEEKEGGIHP